ncbi:DnaJ domain-containing protein [Clostridium gasigenes]|uniref:J domain-containing protein n=1 Tax=Clostridium gasigenes TaxID=94869 RepID=UPI001C0B69C8|nr:DnaJ domain-containing protein [Clostridium gasigenes]MBU3089958.1 DnaJ domain-containing protein [Clostridium gasigenes]
MDYYNILGVKENASKEEIKSAYENKVKKIKEEVPNEKRSKLFIKAFDEAYEALMKLEASGQVKQSPISTIEVDENRTVIIKPQEIQQEKQKQRSVSSGSVNSETKKKSTRKSSNTSSQKKSNSKKDYSEDEDKEKKNKERRNEKKNKQRVARESENSTASTIMKILILPLKILALPIIAILSVIILLCKMINIVSWIASKVIIVGAIGIGAIHLYQINLGQVMDEKLLFAVVVAVIVSFFLPSILRVVPKVLESLNDVLKDLVF